MNDTNFDSVVAGLRKLIVKRENAATVMADSKALELLVPTDMSTKAIAAVLRARPAELAAAVGYSSGRYIAGSSGRTYHTNGKNYHYKRGVLRLDK